MLELSARARLWKEGHSEEERVTALSPQSSSSLLQLQRPWNISAHMASAERFTGLLLLLAIAISGGLGHEGHDDDAREFAWTFAWTLAPSLH